LGGVVETPSYARKDAVTFPGARRAYRRERARNKTRPENYVNWGKKKGMNRASPILDGGADEMAAGRD